MIGLQAFVVGIPHGVVATDHPLPTLTWSAARESFYAAAHDGLDADLAWITRDGDHTTDPTGIYDEVFTLARRGLCDRGLGTARVEELLVPIEARWAVKTTPGTWKRRQVQKRLAAVGTSQRQ